MRHVVIVREHRMNLIRLAALGGIAAIALGAGVAAFAAAPSYNPIVTRQSGQLLVLGSFVGIRQALLHKLPVKPFAEPALAMSKWFAQYPTLFPPGSDKGDNTKALPAIWTHFAAFQKDADNASAAAAKLAMLAKADNTAGFAAQVKVLGGTCLSCHKEFRAK